MRKILISLALITLALGVVAAAGVYAPFTDTAADSGSVTAGDISIRLNTLKGVNEVVWDIPPCISDNMAPGDVCQATLDVYNDGNVWLEYTVSPVETACFDVAFTGPFDLVNGGDGTGAANAGRLPSAGAGPGGSSDVENILATVTLVDDNACQGLTALGGIVVTAESIPTP